MRRLPARASTEGEAIRADTRPSPRRRPRSFRQISCSLARRRLVRRMQRPEKRDEGRGLRRTEVLAVRRHVAPPLKHLLNELVLREAHRDAVETRAALAAAVPESVAVAALFRLEHERSLSLQRRRARR